MVEGGRVVRRGAAQKVDDRSGLPFCWVIGEPMAGIPPKFGEKRIVS